MTSLVAAQECISFLRFLCQSYDAVEMSDTFQFFSCDTDPNGVNFPPPFLLFVENGDNSGCSAGAAGPPRSHNRVVGWTAVSGGAAGE